MSDVDLSSKLLQALNDEDQTAIRECVEDKSVKQWIDNRVDRKQIQNARCSFSDRIKDFTCLGFASGCSDSHTVRLLVQAGADVTATDSTGGTPLHWVCLSVIEAEQKAEYLLSCDSSLIKARTNINHTPLHAVAAFGGNATVINVLIQHGAEVDERRQDGRTALHFACESGHVACVHELMRHGADVEARDSGLFESTPLQLAADFNRLDCVRVLLDQYSAALYKTNKFGCTALHLAACNGHLEMVKLLASFCEWLIFLRNDHDETADDLASMNGHTDVVEYLKEIIETLYM